MADRETSPRVRTLLADMETTWNTLALEAEEALKQRRRLFTAIDHSLPQLHA
jgi:hypothetical protein